ncbi:hypothetical protein CYMTET_45651 [Cymbomonas tetramitiformis]|uniref:Calcineurin-like phosphoesterase domain-containing protein n=1 Tax=Cymbomonas tetramitiformis TaxID=36881 RepID=A0AAE0BXT3_9CHLO|nr:hypothetical protein CYMTET_45651 [Cymbomonas tetramitiformis]|eukprot:gene8911-10559_t
MKSVGKRKTIIVLFLSTIALYECGRANIARPHLHVFSHRAANRGIPDKSSDPQHLADNPLCPASICFLSIGDFGVGTEAQAKVARQMGNYAEKYGAAFVLGLGDNFYGSGVRSTNDPQWESKFESVYTHNALRNIPWYMSIGDHDHLQSPLAQVEYTKDSSRWRMYDLYYSKHIYFTGKSSKGFSLQLVVTDSVGLEGDVATGPASRRWPEIIEHDPTANKAAGARQFAWLQDVLPKSTADWLIVAGHRPILTGGKRSRTDSEQAFMTRMKGICGQHNVSLYINGHDHTAQHLVDEAGVNYIVNGLGGYDVHGVHALPETRWNATDFHGFALHMLSHDRMEVKWVDSSGNVVGHINIPRRSH